VSAATEDRTGALGAYEIQRRIGAGGMAEVFLARRSVGAGLEQQVVLKSILPSLADQPDPRRGRGRHPDLARLTGAALAVSWSTECPARVMDHAP
jgi:serine/threonine protein kinase